MTNKTEKFNADKLKEARELVGLTQEEVAEKLRNLGFETTSKQSVCSWEKGHIPGLDIFRALRKIYKKRENFFYVESAF